MVLKHFDYCILVTTFGGYHLMTNIKLVVRRTELNMQPIHQLFSV